MDEDIINQIKEAEEFASQMIKIAEDDAKEMIDDAVRNAKNKLDSELKDKRQFELIAFRRLSDSAADEISKTSDELGKKLAAEKLIDQSNIDFAARKVVSKVKDRWQ